MKRFGLFVKLALICCAVIAAFTAPSPTLAYITAESNTVNNSFRVEYLPPQDISVPVTVHKTVLNFTEEEIGPGGFEFYLINSETGDAVTATTADDGWVTVYLPFTAEDVGKTFNYHLYELHTAQENMTFDETVYDIGITLVLNDMHEMSAVLTMDGVPVEAIVAEYENIYGEYAPWPDTGDEARPILWLMMVIVSGIGLVATCKNKAVFRRL